MKIFLSLFLSSVLFAQSPKVLESSAESIIIEFSFAGMYQVKDTTLDGKTFQKIIGGNFIPDQEGEPALPQEFISLGIKNGASLTFKILSDQKQVFKNKFLLPYFINAANGINSAIQYAGTIYKKNQDYPSDAIFVYPSYVYRLAAIRQIGIYPFQFNPVTRELVFHQKMIVQFFYKNQNEIFETGRSLDKSTDEYLKGTVLNYSVSKNWMSGKKVENRFSKKENDYWYNPQFSWLKLFIKKEGIYRVSFSDLIDANSSLLQNIAIRKINLFNNGEEIPLEIFDEDGDSLFNNDDFFQFVGKVINPSPFSKLNIYNNSNVYWLTLNSISDGKRYKELDGYSGGWGKTFQQSLVTLHFEKDILYERLGYAKNLERDFWYWGKASGVNGIPSEVFIAPFSSFENYFPDSNMVAMRVNMHGLTDYSTIIPDHRAKISLTSQLIDSVEWDGQTSVTFTKEIDTKKIGIFSDNNLQVAVNGVITANTTYPEQSRSDEIRINWVEFDYWRENRVDGKYFHYCATQEMFGKSRFSVWNWTTNDMRVYIPERNEVLYNPFFTQNQYREVLFVDSTTTKTDYYCTSISNYLNVDSIKIDTPSQLRNKNQGVDYLIITHKNFLPAAERLKQFRETNCPDSSLETPRIQITTIDDIYDEFSYGLLDPLAVQSYIKYAFENYSGTPISYVVLLGDMSYDYRELFPTNRKNFVPSMPYHSDTYGLAASDNMFVAVSGDDVAPDVAIGRLSCETLTEANNLIDKLMSYPGDAGKIWRQNSLLVASGQDLNDELSFGFNNASIDLERNYLTPNGFSAKKVFRYPSSPEHLPFQGGGAEIRKGIDSGAVIVNYYGHGGGYQWDLIFLTDDIYMLNNEGRLPFISSVTCYTAHFDNQDVFGEQFNKVPGKGSIAFWGSSGLTSFGAGKNIDELFFDEVYSKKNYILGKAILNAKNRTASTGTFTDQIALLTLLGDPLLELAFPQKPDYSVSENLVSINPEFPLANNPVQVKIYIKNFGFIKPEDSLSVELYVIDKNVKNVIGSKKIKSFGIMDSVGFLWTPLQDAANTLIVDVNADRNASEDDFSDNECVKSVYVYKTNEPNIIKPVNGFTSNKNSIEFLFADIGEYIDKKLMYQIQIDTSLSFEKPLVDFKNISPSNGIVEWTYSPADSGIYFWRTRSWAGIDSSKWTETSTFNITGSGSESISFSEKQLKLFEPAMPSGGSENIYYSDSLKGLSLNASFLPAKPTNSKYLGNFPVTLPAGINGLSAITTDGKYLYVGAMYYYNGQQSKIYKIGTGNGSVEGQSYGELSPATFPIFHTIFYLNGKVYIAAGSSSYLKQIDVLTGDTASVFISGGFINENSREKDGGFYLCSDGRYVYNLGIFDTTGAYKYRLRILDPQNNWTKVGEDRELSGTSYDYFSSFFVIDDYLYAFEYGNSNYMRRFDLTTNPIRFEEEWLTFTRFQGYFSWTYDQNANVLYTSVFRQGFDPRIAKFTGKYKNTEGRIVTSAFGPAKNWNSVSYNVDKNNADASINFQLEKYDKNLQQWELAKENIPTPFLLDTLALPVNSVLRLSIKLKDTSTVSGNALNIRKIGWNFSLPTELSISKNGLQFNSDSLLQGFPLEFHITPQNISSTPSDTFQIACYLDGDTIPFYSNKTILKADSSITFNSVLETAKIGDQHKIKVEIKPYESETFSFNNFIEKKFFIRYDTLRPTLQILIDGREILDGDIVSKEPEIEVSLKDNSPLPISKNNFSISVDNIPVDVTNIRDSISPYPNNQTILKWKELSLKEGEHFLDVFAKDSSGNYFDASVRRTVFYTYTENDIKYVYNYPNPFASRTHFTFELRGERKPDEMTIRIFTIAGRLIKEIKPSSGDFSVGFNKIFWDGKDQDGDPIANGLYLYKVIAKFNDKTVTTTQKLVKME
ncbi:MAG: C25 family cysteine peptidase [Ignavibacteriaceae bacterium]|nr:C25 family cysteine peptidase [Ignavibacteriaceae bacterium]